MRQILVKISFSGTNGVQDTFVFTLGEVWNGAGVLNSCSMMTGIGGK